MNLIWKYLVVAIVLFWFSIGYVWLLRRIYKRKHVIKHPFNFDKGFRIELHKFGVIYLADDIVKFAIEWFFIVWFTNAIILRIIGTAVTILSSWFFWWFRNFMIEKHNAKYYKTPSMRKYVWDTLATIIFRWPIYIWQLLILYAFHLTSLNSVFIGIAFCSIGVFIFGRLVCYVADWYSKRVWHHK